MKTKTTTLAPRALAVAAVQALGTASAIAWRDLNRAAHLGATHAEGWEPTTENVASVWADAGQPLKGNSPKTYASELARAFKMGAAGVALPDLRACTSARQVKETVFAAYDAAGLKSAKGAKAAPDAEAKAKAKTAEAEAKAARLAARAAEAKRESAQFVAAVQGAKAADKAKAAKAEAEAEAAIAEALRKAEAAKVAKTEAARIKAEADAAKAAKEGPRATPIAKASIGERANARRIAQDAVKALAALRAACADDPCLMGAAAGKTADLESFFRGIIGTVDECNAADARGKSE
jgi:hypothetical protein